MTRNNNKFKYFNVEPGSLRIEFYNYKVILVIPGPSSSRNIIIILYFSKALARMIRAFLIGIH